MGITLTHFLSLIVMRCNFLDSIYSSFLPPSLSSSINRMRDLFSNLETVSTDLRREFPDRWIVNTKVVAYAADQILCKLQQLLLGKDAAMASNLPGQNKKLEEVGSSSFSCFATDGFYTSFPSSSEINDEINWIIRILEELLVSGEIKIGYSGVLTYINPGLSEQEVGKLLYSGNHSQPWSEKYKLLMKPSVLMDVPESVNGFFNPIYNRRLRHASPFTLITSLHLSGLSDFVELPGLPVLHTLRISGCERLNAVSICEKLSAVEALEISCCPELTSLTGLNQLLSLRSLLLSFCFNLQFDLHVQPPPLLEYLDLTHCPSLEEWCQNAGFQNWKLDETIESFQRSSRVGDSPVYGRENEKNSIIEFLLSDDFNRNNLTVVCIVGESGIGKTSIVHLIYSEERVLDSFDARMFITMPEKSDETRLIKKLIESVTSSPCPMTEADLLEELLIDELSGTKVFVVLDDAENENPCFWNRIVTILNHSTRGSVLLVTTKSKDVAEVIGAMQTYYLDPLSDYYCWKIFWQHIFTGLSTNANTDLVETGKQLVSKCQHNPLCIKVLAGLLVCSKNEKSWVEILKTDLWNMDGFDGDTLPTLRVGYELLPNNLKKCLHYCSLFPKDYVFAKQQIVRMWMSQGFIIPVEGRQPEEVGLQNFDELLLRGFFQHSPLHDVEEDKFIMHDLIRALATNLSRKKGPPAEDALERIFENCFHFSLNPSKIQMDEMKPLINSDLQSFLALTRFSLQTRINISILDFTSLSDLFTKCINLRTLDLSCTDIVELPSSVGMLKQLRYLCVNNTKIRSIPRALCSLVSLQTLEAKDCQHLVELPESMMELTNLRHLDVSKKSGCVKMMIGIGQLTNLQSLAVFCVGCEMPYCSIRELKDLNCLSSCLQIAGLENIRNGLDAKEAALHNKVHLNTLWLHWNDNRTCTESEESVTISEEVLNNLKPNPKIGELIIRNYRGNLFPTWMGDPSFSKLVSIILDKCLNCSQFPALGGLPSLRHLSVQKLYHLVRLENADSQFVSKNTPKFPSLETLNLWEMYDLEELFETSDRDFPCLRTLSISRCPMLKRIPCFSSLLNLSLYCCVKLPYLPDLPSLKSLRIDGFQKMKSLELPKDLPALKKLEIRHCNELLLVEGLPKLPSLEKLNVVHCPKFDSLKNWKPCHSKPISTTRWFFQKEESTTQMEHQETTEPAEKHTEGVVMALLDDSKKRTKALKTAEPAEKRTKALKTAEPVEKHTKVVVQLGSLDDSKKRTKALKTAVSIEDDIRFLCSYWYF
ncbi:Disease resistance protein RGA2 [Carex littledalei]|uniref:Disease resistance protein RGA2 n=1 Tax=Carex littledalei TaxID=544730 RepID=A0A833VGB0_9POAL|nr:Disease resistance protein RGA2 [Carex littledalei]